MTSYLLDTNVVSEFRRSRPHGAVVKWFRDKQDKQLLLSAVTIGELQAGIEITRYQDQLKASSLEEWLNQLPAMFQVLPMDTQCFREWARLIRRKPAQLWADAMIASTARVHGLVVATRNERDFSHFDVRVINPFKPD
jgi:predicted nucleic acid-binding protein